MNLNNTRLVSTSPILFIITVIKCVSLYVSFTDVVLVFRAQVIVPLRVFLDIVGEAILVVVPVGRFVGTPVIQTDTGIKIKYSNGWFNRILGYARESRSISTSEKKRNVH